MKFTCEKSQLMYAINTSMRAASPKSAVPSLEGLLIEACNVVTITGYNLKTGIRTTVNADIIEDGSIVLDARLFAEIVRKFEDDVITIETDNNLIVNITCGMSSFEIMGISPDDYPELPAVENTNYIQLHSATLKSMIRETIFAISDNEARPIHTGSLFDLTDTDLTVVSVDGYRLALRKEDISLVNSQIKSFVVPGYALTEVERVLTDGDESLTKISIGSKHILFNIDTTTIVSRRLEGEFLNYKNSVPKTSKFTIDADKKALISSIERVSLIINDKTKSPVRCIFGKDVLNLSTATAIGKAQDECVTEGDGEKLEIGFNNKYLLDALKAAPNDKLRLKLSTGVTPCIVVPADDSDRFLYMILPVRLRANEN